LNPALPPGSLNPPQCQEVDFDIILTKQQPTYWVVGAGRRYDPSDPMCSPARKDCFNAGFDPGLVPPVADPFVGELKCIEVDSAGAPLNGNHLKGEAQIVADYRATPVGSREVSKYNAIGVMGLNTDLNSNDGDTALCLGGGVSARCPSGPEYNACPAALVMNHYAEGASDPVVDVTFGAPPSRVNTALTIVPCTEDFENQRPTSVTVQFRVTNEFEELFSASTTVSCWGTFGLSQVGAVFEERFLGTRFAQTRMVSPDEQSGFVAVVEEFHSSQPAGGGVFADVSRGALNVPVEGERLNGDVITVPEGP
jgi:hypothetical protein